MLCFASAMVMLTEYDENMTSYLSITPIGKNGYLISRLLIPALIAFLFSVTLLLLFSLTVWNILLVIIICLINCFISVIISLLVFSYSSNKVEGMAMAKMAGLVMIGLPVPYFLKSVHQYVFCLLPSFWVAKLCVDSNYIFVIPVIITCLLWFVILYKKFIKKLR
jgi:fluoroquinolone transport system permease protein